MRRRTRPLTSPLVVTTTLIWRAAPLLPYLRPIYSSKLSWTRECLASAIRSMSQTSGTKTRRISFQSRSRVKEANLTIPTSKKSIRLTKPQARSHHLQFCLKRSQSMLKMRKMRSMLQRHYPQHRLSLKTLNRPNRLTISSTTTQNRRSPRNFTSPKSTCQSWCPAYHPTTTLDLSFRTRKLTVSTKSSFSECSINNSSELSTGFAGSPS